jgi:acetyltransferase-like isoleucine patch superfamily enzyme
MSRTIRLKNIIKKLISREKNRSLIEKLPQYAIGKHSYWSGKPVVKGWGEDAVLKMGSFCSIARGVRIYLGGEHRTDWVTTFPFNILWQAGKGIEGHPKTKGDVVIGNDVWIGRDAVITSGVTIGDGAVIGGSAVVSKNVEPYTIVAGNPAVIVRKRFDDAVIEKLLEIQWWNWDDARIEKAVPLLLSNDLNTFIEAVEEKRV